jgi:hypothetical protein
MTDRAGRWVTEQVGRYARSINEIAVELGCDWHTINDHGRTRVLGLLDAGDPHGDVRPAWHAKEVARSIYDHHDPDLAVAFVERLGHDLQDESCPVEVRSLGRTLLRWKDQIAAWHHAQVSQGPTEGINNLIKRVKRAAFGMTASATSGSESYSTPADPTGPYSPPSHPAESEEPG